MLDFEKTINELCPNGVEYVKLSDVLVSVKTGLNPRQNFKLNIDGANNYYVTVKEITTGKILFSDKTDRITDEARDIIQNRSRLEMGDVLLSGIGTIGKVALVDIPTDNWNCSESVFLLKPKKELIEPKFLMYLLASKNVQKQWESQSVGSTLRGIRMETVNSLLVPLPPLAAQREIVHVLDKFALLLSELTMELALRKKQYSELAYQLLKKKNTSPMYFVKDVCLLTKGKTPIQKAIPGEYPMVVTTTERKTCSTYQFDAQAVCIPLVSSRGHGVASLNHVYYQEGKFALGNILCAVIPKDNKMLSAKYLYYYFECTKDYTLVPLMKGGANVSMHIPDIEKLKIPIPNIDIQNDIVKILDKFDKLVNDFSEGLPAEIEARQKQYEYYRDKLLTFKKLS